MKSSLQNMFSNILRVAAILLVFIFIILFLGFTLRGLIDISKFISNLDLFYGIAFSLLGSIFIGIAIKYLRNILKKDWNGRLQIWWQKNYAAIIVSLVIFLIVFLFQDQIKSLIVYAGSAFGSFIINTARITYLQVFGIDLNKIYIQSFSWVFEWFYILVVVGWLLRLMQKFKF